MYYIHYVDIIFETKDDVYNHADVYLDSKWLYNHIFIQNTFIDIFMLYA